MPPSVWIYGGYVEAIAALLQAGANKDLAAEDGWTPLHIAAQNGHVEAIVALLHAGANKDMAKENGWTPLHIAAENGHVEAISALLQAGANKDAAMENGWTPLHIAAQNGYVEAIAALLQAGANKDAAMEDGSTPIRVAAYGGHVAVMHALLLAEGVNEEARSEGCWTPLHLACLDGDLARVEQLLQQGAPVDAVGKGGWTPLHLALCGGSCEVAERLLGGGASASKATTGYTPLHHACFGGHVDVAELLIRNGASLTHADKGGNTPLHNASYAGQTGVVQALLRARAPLEVRNNDGLTPLHRACQGGLRDVVEALLRAGADHEAKTNDGKTPLELARAQGFGGLADRLLQHAADMATSVRVAPRSKVVLVGPGGAGKTTLARRLVHNQYKDDIPPTDNLEVHELTLKGVDQQPPTMLSIWDLGGQHGFWSTHAIFMSPEAVYITVYNSRDGGQGASVDAYLDRVQTLAPGAINMVVGAWADKGYTGQQPPAAALSGYKNPVAPRSKVVLVGPGGAGKTTLARRLVHNQYKDDIPPTDNLEVHELTLKGVDQQPPTMLSIWDLGGQHGFWSTHAIFMSPEAVYITVYNSRDSGQGASVDAYLDRVQTLAPGAINMVVGAWAEPYVRLRDKVRSLREQIKKEDRPRLVPLKDIIRDMGTEVPQEADLHRFLSKLSDFGELLQFQHVSGLEDKVVIDPEWLADVLGDVVTRGEHKKQLLQLPESPVSSMPVGHVSKRRVYEAMEARCPGNANELVRILEAYGLLYDLGDDERAIVPPMLPTLKADDIEKFLRKLHYMKLERMWRFGVFLQQEAQHIVVAYDPDQRPTAGPLSVFTCGPEPELLGLLVASQLAQVREQFPGVKLSSIKYDCPECLGSNDTRSSPHEVTATVVWKQAVAECVECGELSDMSMYALDEQAVDWYPVKGGRKGGMPRGMAVSQGESEGTLKLHRSLGAMERMVKRVKDLPNGITLAVELRQSLIRRAVALFKLVGPSGGEHLPLAVLLPAPDDGASNHRMELDLDSTTSGLPGSVRLHALCEYPGGLHLTDHGGLGAGDPEEEVADGRKEMQRTHSRGRSGATGAGEVGPTEQLDSMLACLDRLVEQQDGLLRTAGVTPTAEGKGDIEGKPADLYSACQEACSSIASIIRQGNAEVGGNHEAGDLHPAAGGMPGLQRVVTRTAGPMWLCACHAEEELGRTVRRT
ncbi:hypothetical protein GPECTOR_18g1 [Gonium pectorale]|uniref:COR domain-containing protein n=1 Tax=Gonium pectorale TaxID=33097 RepID=A0A150GKR4_GONPE|nr:hypothetical protein GPECTOR_18g1 [Gonium pectorale]|eukprot:KXZ49940.1 hypothetical protein GPECTOR_18g1 [Gonium pectorale]